MRLVENEGKELLRAVGIRTPAHEVVSSPDVEVSLNYPLFLKSQVPVGDRMRKGGILEVTDATAFSPAARQLFVTPIEGHVPEYLLAEERIDAKQELYVSFSYEGRARGPVFAINASGGAGVASASVTPIAILEGLDATFVANALAEGGIFATDTLVETVLTLWKLFITQKLALLEINPLFICADESVIAGDAKIVTDPAVTGDGERPFISLGGNIAVIASGGGASMLTMDMLMRAGGRPANYVEYSGNPPAAIVEELTVRVLSEPGLKGAWIVGGTANFTDTYETMSGFLDGLRRITPKPAYPIVVRRDGPRQPEAKALLEQAARNEGYDITVFGPECSMATSAAELLTRMQNAAS